MFNVGIPHWEISNKEANAVDNWMKQTGTVSNANLMHVLSTHPTKGYYLPSENSKCITRSYLVGIMLGKFFSVKIDGLKLLNADQLKKTNITAELCYQEIIRFFCFKDINLGFDADSLPDKNWLLTILWNLVPNHLVFMTDIDDKIDQELKAFLPSDLCPSETYKKNRHPSYKKYLKLKKIKRNIKKEIKSLHVKQQSAKDSFSTFLDS